jgi:uncharacterized cupredoxin-like copper-binding protein
MSTTRVAVAAAAFLAAVLALAVAAATATPPPRRTLGVTIAFSRFEPVRIHVTPGETVRFVIVNDDPIDHEFLVGGLAFQRSHERGTEATHGARPEEVSVPAGATVETTITFPERIGPNWEFACHLPGHYEYGMRGAIVAA